MKKPKPRRPSRPRPARKPRGVTAASATQTATAATLEELLKTPWIAAYEDLSEPIRYGQHVPGFVSGVEPETGEVATLEELLDRPVFRAREYGGFKGWSICREGTPALMAEYADGKFYVAAHIDGGLYRLNALAEWRNPNAKETPPERPLPAEPPKFHRWSNHGGVLTAEYAEGKGWLTVAKLRGDPAELAKLPAWEAPKTFFPAPPLPTVHKKHVLIRIKVGKIRGDDGLDTNLADTFRLMKKRGVKLLGYTVDEEAQEYKIRAVLPKAETEKEAERGTRVFVPGGGR